MSGELQSIPARHGTATFVPKGQTIRIINTYGRQVVDTWVFALPKPPEKEDVEREEQDIKEEAQAEAGAQASPTEEAPETTANAKPAPEASKVQEDGDVEEQEPEAKIVKESGKESELLSDEAEEKAQGESSKATADAKTSPPKLESNPAAQRAGWSSYLPSLRARGKQPAKPSEKKDDASKSKPKAEGESRTWASYFPSGKGFSSYLPSSATTKGSLSAFAATHQRDPTKSIAEQLYDFSKTPVGAATLSAATGSSVSSSLYAAYTAYTKLPRPEDDFPPMEYFSAPHTRVETKHVIPKVGDMLVSNLHTPLMKFVEDTSAGHHDTVTPACNAQFYRTIGIEKWEEHGSCAENLVLALKELNEKAGLKGRRAVGADISVNIAPTPLHLFMNATTDGGEVHIDEPKGPKRSHVKLKAERDVVVVMSACPNEKGVVNGGKCMAANFVVEEDGGDFAATLASASVKRKPKPLNKKSAANDATKPQEQDIPPEPDTGAGAELSPTKVPDTPSPVPENGDAAKEAPKQERRKPKKLERRGTPVHVNKEGSKE